MQQKHNDSTPQRPEGKRYIDAPIVRFDIEKSLMQIRSEQTYKESDRNAITLFKSTALTIVLISLHADAEMKTHATEGMSSLQVLKGTVSFNMNGHSLELEEGEIITIHEGIPHGLRANTEVALLLTITANPNTREK